LEPEPEEPELTFTQRMLLNRAQGIMTMKMKKRMRNKQVKMQKKMLQKMGKDLSRKAEDLQIEGEAFEEDDEGIFGEEEEEAKGKKNGISKQMEVEEDEQVITI